MKKSYNYMYMYIFSTWISNYKNLTYNYNNYNNYNNYIYLIVLVR